MINTSSRTKILLLVYKHKSTSYKNILKKYNAKIILDNRLKIFKTNR